MEFKDRVANKPNRMKITYEDSGSSVFANVELADEPIEDGTPLNAVNMNKLLNKEDNDYIVEQGIDGRWTYRKWKSGIAECWCCITKNLSAFNEFSDNHWYKPFENVAFPDGLFNSMPVVSVTLSNNTGGGAGQGSLVLQKSNPTKESTGVIYALLPSKLAPSGEVPCSVSIDVKGRWE